MATSFVTANEQTILSGLLDNTFQTFQREIVIWKTPIKMPISTSQEPQGSFGFGGAPLEQQYEYIPVSGVFPAVVRYATSRHIGEAPVLQDTNSMIPIGEVRIKVRPDCYNFIEDGTTDKISFDNRDWYFVGKPQAVPFLGGLWYFFQLKPKI
jgi:hypothetical protein